MSSGKLEFALLRDVDDAMQRAVIGACTPRRFTRREVVFHEGDPGDCLHLVVSGRFAVRVTTPRGDGVTLRVIGAGEVFGELVLLDPHARRVATVVALEPARTLVLTAARFAALRRRHPEVDRVLVAMLADNVRRLSGQVLEALYVPVDERVARRLHELAGVYGAEVPVTQDDLAGMAGTTRASANLALRRLADRGVVTLGRGRIVVHRLPALGREAEPA
jgi:CRP-like cAMP-binding protein